MSKKENLEANHQEWMGSIPERLLDWEKDSASERAVLLVPRFRKGLLKKWVQPKLKKPFMKVKLDEIGSFVWEHCDGKTKVKDIASALDQKFGERVQPAENRLKLFFGTMFRSDFIRYWKAVSE